MWGWSRLATASASLRNRRASTAVAQDPVAHHLESDEAVQISVPSAVDDSHPAPRDFAQHLVVTDDPVALERKRRLRNLVVGKQKRLGILLSVSDGPIFIGRPQRATGSARSCSRSWSEKNSLSSAASSG